MQNERIGEAGTLLEPEAPDVPSENEISRLNHLIAIRRLLGIILLVLVVMGFYFARDVVLPLMIGLLLALTFSPVVRALQRIGIAPPITATASSPPSPPSSRSAPSF